MAEFTYYSQMAIEELQAKAQASAAKAAKKGVRYEPVIVTKNTKSLCTNWWGVMWMENLARYADYDNRLPRGKRYVKAGAVIDLKVLDHEVHALVQGSRKKPYKVVIRFDPIPQKQKKEIEALCARYIRSLETLINGDFPEELRELLSGQNGLFPKRGKIRFGCSCPDYATMCKHVAAVMYAIGIKVDENPFYFFSLRGIDTQDLIAKTVENKVEALLAHADVKSSRIIEGIDLESVFDLSE